MTKGTTDGKYWDQYKQLHKAQKYGISGDRLIENLLPIIRKDCDSILDYGAGQANTIIGLRRALGIKMEDGIPYDPNVEGRDTKPERDFHTVICTDVLEHIPEEELDDVLVDIWGYADEEAIFVIALRLAGQILPNGDNAHCTVYPKEWWEKKLRGIWTTVEELPVFHNPYCIAGFKVSSRQQ